MNDARLIHESLDANERLALDKTALLLNREATRTRILELCREYSHADGIQGLVVYFAGHGLSLDDENYLVPWDGLATPRQVAGTCLALPDLLAACSNADRPALVAVDACRCALTPHWSEVRPYFAAAGLGRIDPPEGTDLVLSTGPDKTGLVSNRLHHGVFTLNLADILTAPAYWDGGFPAFDRVLRELTSRMASYSAHSCFRIASPWPVDESLGGHREGDTLGGIMPRVVRLFESKRNDQVEKTIRAAPGWAQDPGMLTALSVVYRNRGELAPGERYVRKALELDRHYSFAYLALGNIQVLKRDYSSAEESYQLAIRLDDSMSLAHYGLGTVECYRNNLAAALVHYLQAIRVDPSWAMPHTGLGYVYLKLGQVETAVNEYRESIRLDPGFYYAYYGMGRAMKEFKRYQLAEANQRECLRFKPGFVGSLYELGDVLRLQDRPAEALDFYQESLEADSGYIPSYYGLATLYADADRADLAREQLESALTLDPTSARTHQLLADLHFSRGDLDPARYHAELAVSFVKPGDEEFGDCQRILNLVTESG